MTRRHQHGFSLIEVAIALMIMGLLTVGIVGTLSSQNEQRRFADTRAVLDKAREALLAFVAANGRLPCPATVATRGHENVVQVGALTTCPQESGLLPAVTLGLSDLDPDGWLNNGWRDSAATFAGPPARPRTLRYAVTALAGAEASALTSRALGAATPAAAAIRRAAVQTALTGPAQQGLFVCASGAGIVAAGNRCGGNPNTLAGSVVATVWSLGPNGNSPAQFSPDEAQNANQPVPRVLISRVNAPAGAVGGMFDDQVTWLPFPLVAERLVTFGHVN